MLLREFTLSDVIDRNASLYGTCTAFIAGDTCVTHGEYATRVLRLAGGLRALGLATKDRVAVIARNRLEYVDLYGAAARLGFVLVPINWRLSKDEIAYLLADSSPSLVAVDSDYASLVRSISKDVPSIEHSFIFAESEIGFESFHNLYLEDITPIDSEASGDSGFVIFYTAAAGGRPRGALLSQAGLLSANLQQMLAFRLSTRDVNLGGLPLFHAAGLGLMLAVQQAGGATVLLTQFEASEALAAIKSNKVSVFSEFSPILKTLLDEADKGGADLQSLRHVVGLDGPETISRFESVCPDARFWAAYGQTEVSGLITMAPYRAQPGSAGQPTPLANVRIIDGAGRSLPAGRTGEIVVRGPMVFLGYWAREADTAFTFRDGWHHTGDLGHLDGDGNLWYEGRRPEKELIKPGGENVYPAEVEQALLAHPSIAEAVVFGVPDQKWGEAVKAVCVLRSGHSVIATELIDFVGMKIARFKRPKIVEFTDSLPRDAQGVPDRQKIKSDYSGH